jgi:hypothetical protein
LPLWVTEVGSWGVSKEKGLIIAIVNPSFLLPQVLYKTLLSSQGVGPPNLSVPVTKKQEQYS